MNEESGLSIDQPVSIWKRPVNVNPRDLFKALGKAALDGAFMKWDSLGGDLIEAIAGAVVCD